MSQTEETKTAIREETISRNCAQSSRATWTRLAQGSHPNLGKHAQNLHITMLRLLGLEQSWQSRNRHLGFVKAKAFTKFTQGFVKAKAALPLLVPILILCASSSPKNYRKRKEKLT